MLRFLFPRLTAAPPRGQPLFDSVVAEARARHWYAEGGVPDTVDGRFAMLATVCALANVRLDSLADGSEEQSAALTERFVEAMDAEHRQMGINDPTLGKRVRKMVGSLARRVEEWRATVAGDREWGEVVRSSVHRGENASDDQLGHCVAKLRQLWERLRSTPDEAFTDGRF